MSTRAGVAVATLVLLNGLFPLGRAVFAEAPDSNDLLTGFSLTSWSDGDGHPLGSVYAIVQDQDGYLWLGADAGLFRFDGSRFTSWNEMSEASLPPVAVTALHVARDQSLWVGLADGFGVRRLHDGSVEVRTEGLSATGAVTDLVEDRQGTMWAVGNRTFFRLHSTLWRKVNLPWKEREGTVLQPYVTRSGELWVGTRWGVFRQKAEGLPFEQVSDEYVWGLAEDTSGAIWTTDIVAGYRKLGASTPPRRSVEGAGFRLAHDRNGNLWIATFGEGLWRVRNGDTSGGSTIERASLRTGLSSDSVQSLLEDREGNIWVGTTGGLHRLMERKLTPVENVGFVVAMEPAEGARMWAGTTNGIIQFSIDPNRWERVGVGLTGPDVRSLHRDADGTLWVGATDGLWRVRAGRLVKVPLPERPRMLILSISPDGEGGLWLADGEWLFRWNGTRLTPFEAPTAISEPRRITFARRDTRGRLWLGFTDGRLGVLDPDGKLRMLEWTGGPGGTHNAIYSVLDDEDDVVWIGGSEGLSRYARGRVVTVGRANGLPGDRVWAIVEDRQRRLWLSVDRGLVRVDRAEVDRALEDPSYRMQYAMYDTLDGLAGAAIGIIGSARATDGRLWFVRGGGVTLVNPATLSDERASDPAPVHIESVVANDRQFRPTPDLSFSPGTTRIQISYTALTLSSSNRLRFRYQLEGFDTSWVDAGTRRTAFYTNLSPGRYQFLVEAGAEDGSWSTSSTSWGFSIHPAFYQTNWFYAASLGALGLSVWGAWRVRLRLVRRQFSLALAERVRLSREIHDTLLQSLVGVALQIDAISSHIGPSSVGTRKRLTRVRRQVESYIREARQSIWDLRSSLLETCDLASALREFGKRAVTGTQIRFQATVTGTPAPCSTQTENQLLRIGQEAITNAVRHAGATRITLELAYDRHTVTIRVSDNGSGFDVSQSAIDPDRHYGLTTMRERAEELGGQFRLVSRSDRGTSVEAVVPQSAAASGERLAEG
jgi:signal transduction histidine kinase/ligand-binding sensor domain-containing protein